MHRDILKTIEETARGGGDLLSGFKVIRHCYVNTSPAHMPNGLADRLAHDERLAKRGERDES